MSVLAADMPLLPPVFFCIEGGQSATLPPMEPFGNFLNEHALLTTPPVQQANEFPALSPALAPLAPLLEAAPEAGKEEEFPPDKPLEEEAQAWHSILQTVQTLLHSVQARMLLPGLGSDISAALPGPIPQESVLTQPAQRSITLPCVSTFSAPGHTGMPQAAEAALMSMTGMPEEPVTNGITSRADNPAAFQEAEIGTEPGIVPRLARAAQHEASLSTGTDNPAAFQEAEIGTEPGIVLRLARAAEHEVGLSSHAVGSAGQGQETMLQDGWQRASGPIEEAYFPLEHAPAAQTPMHFTGSGRAERQSGTPVFTSAEARASGLPPQTVALTPEPVAQLSERSSPQHMLLLQLQPPELGAMRIRVRLAQAQLSASFWADSPEVRSLLQSHFPSLHQNLSEQGFQVQQLSMSLTTGDFAGHLGHSAQQYSALQPHVYSKVPPVAGEQSGEALAASPVRRSVARRGLVDVVI